jgi:hypothetical protein
MRIAIRLFCKNALQMKRVKKLRKWKGAFIGERSGRRAGMFGIGN